MKKLSFASILLLLSFGIFAQISPNIKLAKNQCTPFNLQDLKLKNLSISPQYYSNCYSSGAANLVNSWLLTKTHHKSENKLQVSPHHLAIIYALYQKPTDYNNSRSTQGADWKVRKDGDITRFQKYQNLMKEVNKSEEDLKKLSELIQQRYYYFEEHGGNAMNSIKIFKTRRVCPLNLIEGRFISNENATQFFQSLRITLTDVLKRYHQSDKSILRTDLINAMNRLYVRFKVTSNFRLNQNDWDQLIFNQKIDQIDPLKILDSVFHGLCRDQSFSLNDIYNGSYSHNMPQITTHLNSTGPTMNKDYLISYFNKKPEDLSPLGISYAGHAIWDGPSKLAWAWSEEKNAWENKPFGGHQSIVIGRKWNEEKQYCEYLVRNSIVTSTAKGWRKDSKNNYNLWIRDDYLYRSINWSYYLY